MQSHICIQEKTAKACLCPKMHCEWLFYGYFIIMFRLFWTIFTQQLRSRKIRLKLIILLTPYMMRKTKESRWIYRAEVVVWKTSKNNHTFPHWELNSFSSWKNKKKNVKRDVTLVCVRQCFTWQHPTGTKASLLTLSWRISRGLIHSRCFHGRMPSRPLYRLVQEKGHLACTTVGLHSPLSGMTAQKGHPLHMPRSV